MHPAYRCARGEFQLSCIDAMLSDGCSDSLMQLVGKAKSYWPSYKRSLSSLITRLRAAGIAIECNPSGPRGGLRWHIVG